ncbi:hypothetical protein C8R44DRAFT_799756 [Mycena epipterygia]|nr:hypothetical protein C8R44DRAFT_799756 [Mycena epipterygia]
MKLTSFTMQGDGTRNRLASLRSAAPPLQIVSPGNLRKLISNTLHDTAALFIGFGQVKLPHLVSLSVIIHFPFETFLHFLTQCPCLESLAIRSGPHNSVPSVPKYLPAGTVPHLRDITAQLDVVILFAPTRPVTAVKVLKDGPGRLSLTSSRKCMLALASISQGSKPLRSLAIPRMYTTQESLSAIADVFPELREFSIEIPGQTQRPENPPRPPRRSQSKADSCCPDLRDDDAFDDLPAEDISDGEDEPPTVALVDETWMPGSTAPYDILNDLCGGFVSLPPQIEVVRLREVIFYSLPSIVVDKQHQIVAALSRLYPALREVEIGRKSNTWERNGSLWKRRGEESYLQVVSGIVGPLDAQ